jgi:3-dehydroquinate dehydratase
MGKFLYKDTPNLTVMLQCRTPEVAIGRIRNALHLGADAFGLQVESLLPEYQNPETYQRIFKEMRGKPAYVTNYHSSSNKGKSDEELAEGLLTLADCGATLCDVQGDLFAPHPLQMTEDAAAIEKQMALIDAIHSKGAEVLMSAHTNCYLPGEKVLELAMEQKRRGADIIKIVTDAADMQAQMENLKTVDLLKRELGAPFLFLSGGECGILRRLGTKLGCCMALCVYEHDALSTPGQPLLSVMKQLEQITF